MGETAREPRVGAVEPFPMGLRYRLTHQVLGEMPSLQPLQTNQAQEGVALQLPQVLLALSRMEEARILAHSSVAVGAGAVEMGYQLQLVTEGAQAPFQEGVVGQQVDRSQPQELVERVVLVPEGVAKEPTVLFQLTPLVVMQEVRVDRVQPVVAVAVVAAEHSAVVFSSMEALAPTELSSIRPMSITLEIIR